MFNTYVIATPRLSARVRRSVGLGDVMLWDTNRPYHYARWTPDRRLIFGGDDRPAQAEQRAAPRRSSRARRHCSRLVELLYPALRGVRPEYAWEGLFATTPDGLPYIGTHGLYPHHLFALGYGGNGMTFGFLAAEILDRMIGGHGATGGLNCSGWVAAESFERALGIGWVRVLTLALFFNPLRGGPIPRPLRF